MLVRASTKTRILFVSKGVLSFTENPFCTPITLEYPDWLDPV